jgi:TonB family protein
MKACNPLLVLSVALAVAPAVGQPDDADAAPSTSARCDLTSLQPSPLRNINVQQPVATAIRQANACLGQRDAVCADAALTPSQTLVLTGGEQALLAIPRAELATLRGETATAEEIYRETIRLPAIGGTVQREIAWRLAFVLSSRGELAEALRVFGSIGCDSWSAEALTVRAITYEGLGARTLALENYEAAKRLYDLEGRAVPAALETRYQELLAAEAPKPIDGTDRIALSMRNPDYPERALQRGVSGWVQLEFDITDMGAVENVRVAKSTDQVFDQISITTVQRWRYVPSFENGLPLRRNNEQTVIKFCLAPCRFGRNPPPERGPDGRYPP